MADTDGAGAADAISGKDKQILVKTILRELDLGNSVAEFDQALERYFVETETFRIMVRDGADIIAGDKGTGKTALYRILQQRYREIPELEEVEVLPGFNSAGSPVFQRLAEGEVLDEGQYVTIWKAYILSLTGNWILQIYQDAYTDRMYDLEELLRKVGLHSPDYSPNTVFSQIVNLFRRITNPKAVEVAVSISPSGLPVVVPRIELGEASTEGRPRAVEIPHDEALRLLNSVLEEVQFSVWLVLDRLDEAFAGFPAAEVPALRALLRTYLDLTEFQRIRLKLFVRKDLFRRIIEGGFVNLTHVNARKIEIRWEEDDLLDLLIRRIRENPDFLGAVGIRDGSNKEVFNALFPEQVDPGTRKPTTWTWMVSRIRDANNIQPPRNLIDLVKKAQEAQVRREEREENEFERGQPLLKSEALKLGLSRLSHERVEDTLLAEAGEFSPLIEKFRGGKAEHNRETLSTLLGMTGEALEGAIGVLREIGFLEAVGTNFKVPMLYRDGLGITQGKAFTTEGGEPADEGQEDEE